MMHAPPIQVKSIVDTNQAFRVRKRKMRTLRNQGFTDREIGALFKVSAERVAQILGRRKAARANGDTSAA